MNQQPSWKERIRAILANRQRQVITDDHLVRAAVLLLICEKDGEPHLLFTKRTEKVEQHKGQISFPGGVHDAEDESFLATALRETFEEVGIRPQDVEVLGELDDTATISTSFVVAPFVASIPYPYPFRVSSDEVERLILVPLAELLKPANFRQEAMVRKNCIYPLYFYYCEDSIIWGATARILKSFFDLIYPGWDSR